MSTSGSGFAAPGAAEQQDSTTSVSKEELARQLEATANRVRREERRKVAWIWTSLMLLLICVMFVMGHR
ncbi:hypothetical protein CHLRE_09g386740v5 [Chlamydomonas reinhardtii]|uniref:Uncharacterized protein n=1 Tax=Chlamydomonas reinhardtii TaxID=3055 RepID=A0A2K3DCG6_CHLRE|nr:uncharacterized protein CHLRE_09g386740v5 [Chlamydomonas reinhardtii]PNW78219.1 hypothetical protein CHLRE_09g386740v5 [Chlamydomonas reinhardtii]